MTGALECFRARKESALCKKGKACRDQAGEMRLETAGPQQEHLLGSFLPQRGRESAAGPELWIITSVL